MMTATAYYDGRQIVLDDKTRKDLIPGQQITLTFSSPVQKSESRAERRKRIVESGKYSKPSGRTTEETEKMIKEMREQKEATTEKEWVNFQ